MTELQSIRVPTVESASILASVVCGVDGSEEAAEAVRQAALLAAPAARFELVGVIHAGLVESVASVMPALTVEPERLLRKQAWAALEDASRDVRGQIEVTTTLRTGPAAALLEVEARRLEADTIAVGSHGQGRLAGKLLGSVATRVVHDARRSVLVARSAPTATFPRRIIVGVDESEPSARALAIGRELSRRTGAAARPRARARQLACRSARRARHIGGPADRRIPRQARAALAGKRQRSGRASCRRVRARRALERPGNHRGQAPYGAWPHGVQTG